MSGMELHRELQARAEFKAEATNEKKPSHWVSHRFAAQARRIELLEQELACIRAKCDATQKIITELECKI